MARLMSYLTRFAITMPFAPEIVLVGFDGDEKFLV